MLHHLHISAYALIDHLDMDFPDGFLVLTGETGAGKSIILGALGLLLGERADRSNIQPGARRCCVEATFAVDADTLSALGLSSFFSEQDIDFDGESIIVRREVTSAGKSRAFVNDTPVSLAILKALTSRLVDIHSQHQNLLMGQEDFLLHTLDSFAAPAAQTPQQGETGLPGQYRRAFEHYRKAAHRLSELTRQAEDDRREEDWLRFQLSQLSEAALRPGEQEELEQESRLLAHAEEVKSALAACCRLLSGNNETDVLFSLHASVNRLRSIAGVLPEASELAERLESARIETADIAEEAGRWEERTQFDPQRQTRVDERLSLIYSLQKKFGASSVEELLQQAETLQQRVGRINNTETELAQAQKQADEAQKKLHEVAAQLSAARRQAAQQIEAGLVQRLSALGMPDAQVTFHIEPTNTPSTLGADYAQLLFAPSKTLPQREVSAIASGGETARLMLALKSLLAERRWLPTIIFDEIDTGVSGVMAQRMGYLMRDLGARCQVLCITHLPQIAALGRAHYRVSKETGTDGTPTSRLALLSDEERTVEIAHMLSGVTLTPEAMENARALLSQI